MDRHLTIVGVLHTAFGALGLLMAFIIFVAVAGGGLLSGDSEAIWITLGVGSAIAFVLGVISAPAIVGGVGILKRRAWSRPLVLILGFLDLILIPFGTMLGVYTIWVLMQDDAARILEPSAAE